MRPQITAARYADRLERELRMLVVSFSEYSALVTPDRRQIVSQCRRHGSHLWMTFRRNKLDVRTVTQAVIPAAWHNPPPTINSINYNHKFCTTAISRPDAFFSVLVGRPLKCLYK
ncbi:hypothetical protein L596_001315 [Steinernema carpocapsae]|uniref:Uncharacterized protein n=1 Tax=Steinernema carpocapsae TaxID=34508 RepID=A0A4U8UL44_STECR|nr:hypothetical protein L596_001315 [Steinernema carpocapsae]